MTLHFATETGSIYEIDGNRVRRTPEPRLTDENALRGDSEWSELLEPPALSVGRSAVMQIRLPGRDHPTLRTTSPVTRIWHDDKETA